MSSRSSPRAQRLWKRLTDWYGTRLTEQYGKEPPADWCAVVDAADNEAVTRVLVDIRNQHVTYPPTFPEFEALFKTAQKPRAAGPSAVDILDAYMRQHYPEHCSNLTWIGRSGEITGVVIPGVRKVMLDEALAGAA
jgi:hypothetical protein